MLNAIQNGLRTYCPPPASGNRKTLMLIGATETVPEASLTGISFTSTCGGSPTRLAASRSFPVICHSEDEDYTAGEIAVGAPASREPVTFRSNLCSVSVAFTTEMVKYL